MRFIVMMIGFLLLSGCSKHFHWDFEHFNKPMNLSFEPPPGPPHYQQGWKEGCESGLKGYGNQFNKVFFNYKQDPELAQNQEYYQIWKDAYGYCAMYAMSAGNQGLSNNTGRHIGAWIFGDF